MQTSTYSKDSQPDANNLGCKMLNNYLFSVIFSSIRIGKRHGNQYKHLSSHPLDRLITTSNFKPALKGFYLTKEKTTPA